MCSGRNRGENVAVEGGSAQWRGEGKNFFLARMRMRKNGKNVEVALPPLLLGRPPNSPVKVPSGNGKVVLMGGNIESSQIYHSQDHHRRGRGTGQGEGVFLEIAVVPC